MFGDLTQSEIQTHNLYIHVIHVLQHQPYCCIIHGDEIKVVFFFKQLIFITSTLWRLSLIKKTFETLIFSVDVTSFWPWTQWFWKKTLTFLCLISWYRCRTTNTVVHSHDSELQTISFYLCSWASGHGEW